MFFPSIRKPVPAPQDTACVRVDFCNGEGEAASESLVISFGCFQEFVVTPSSAHQAGPSCLKCPKPFLEAKAGLSLDSFPFLSPCSFPRLRSLREGCVGSRTGEGACLFGDGLNLWEEKVQEPLKEKRVHRGII